MVMIRRQFITNNPRQFSNMLLYRAHKGLRRTKRTMEVSSASTLWELIILKTIQNPTLIIKLHQAIIFQILLAKVRMRQEPQKQKMASPWYLIKIYKSISCCQRLLFQLVEFITKVMINLNLMIHSLLRVNQITNNHLVCQKLSIQSLRRSRTSKEGRQHLYHLLNQDSNLQLQAIVINNK